VHLASGVECGDRIIRAGHFSYVIAIGLVLIGAARHFKLPPRPLRAEPPNTADDRTDVTPVSFFRADEGDDLVALRIALPVVLYQIWGVFVAPGLSPAYNRWSRRSSESSYSCSCCGMALRVCRRFSRIFRVMAHTTRPWAEMTTDLDNYLRFVLHDVYRVSRSA